MKQFLILLAVLGLTTACASFSSWKNPAAKFQNRKFFYVESELADGHSLHATIAEELRTMGYNASSGFLTMMPPEADTIVSFQSRWTWDFTTYLIELDLQVRDAKSGKILATVSYHRPGVGGTSTEALIKRVLAETVGAKKPAA
jgi:hypothetical protein